MNRSEALELLKKVGIPQFILFNLISCVAVGSILYLLIHFVGRFITPIGVAVVIVIVTVLPLAYTVIYPKEGMGTNLPDKLQFLGFVLVLLFVAMTNFTSLQLAYGRRDDISSDLGKKIWKGFDKSQERFSGISILAKLTILIVSTLLVELLWPGYLHNLLVTAALAIPFSVLDALLFQRIVYPTVQRETEQ
jgi:hypothetical protein